MILPSAPVTLTNESYGEPSRRASLRRRSSRRPFLHLEDVPIAGAIRPPLTIIGRLTFCALEGSLLGSCSRHSGSVSSAKGTCWTQTFRWRRRSDTARLRVLGRRRQRGLFQVPAGHFDLDRLARPAAQREDAGHIGHLADGNPIHEALAAAEQGLVDGDTVFAVVGDLEIDQRVGVGAEIVVVANSLPPAS